MGTLRALLRVTAIVVHTCAVWTWWLVTRLFVPVAPGLATRIRFWCLGAWARGVAALMGLRIEVVGEPPTAPFFLVSNHLSYVDVLVHMASSRCVLLSKAEVKGWPLIGFVARTTGTLFVDRMRKADLPKVLANVESTLARGCGVVVFPEGTSTRGDEVIRFRSSLFEVAARTDAPVRCAALIYETDSDETPANEWICWHDATAFTAHAWRLLALPSFRARLAFAPDPLDPAPRKVLAERAHDVVSTLFGKISRS